MERYVHGTRLICFKMFDFEFTSFKTGFGRETRGAVFNGHASPSLLVSFSRVISCEEGKALAESWNAAFMESSAKENQVKSRQCHSH